jgi:hypothetical protein
MQGDLFLDSCILRSLITLAELLPESSTPSPRHRFFPLPTWKGSGNAVLQRNIKVIVMTEFQKLAQRIIARAVWFSVFVSHPRSQTVKTRVFLAFEK